MHDVTSALAFVVAVGVAAQYLAWRFRLPAILILLVAGLVAGGTGALDPDAVFGPALRPAVSMAVAIVLFEGGLELDLAEIREAGRVVRRLVTAGVAVTFVVVTLTARFPAGLTWPVATLLGAILVVTGPTVIAPLVRHMRLRGRPASILRTEGILIDPLGALLAVVVFEVVVADTPGRAALGVAGTVATTVAAGCVLGLAGAVGLMWLFRRRPVPEMLQNALVLGTVVGVFGLAEWVHEEAGLFAVVVMGITLGTQRGRRARHMFEFSETLRILLLGALFVVLGARVDLSQLRAAAGGGAAVLAAALLLARPLSVALSAAGSGLSRAERTVLVLVNPRGIVAAAVSSVFALRLAENGEPSAQRLVAITFFVIIGSIVVAAGAGGWFVSRRRLAAEPPRRVLFLGAHALARDIASVLSSQGVDVSLVDTHRPHVRDARLAGLDAHYGSVFSEPALRGIDLASVGLLVALSGNDEVNTLAVQEFAPVVGRDRVFQLAPVQQDRERHAVRPDLLGHVLFDRSATLPGLEARHRAGARVKATRLTDQFDFGVYRAGAGEGSMPLFVLHESGDTDAFTAERDPKPAAGDTVVALVAPSRGR